MSEKAPLVRYERASRTNWVTIKPGGDFEAARILVEFAARELPKTLGTTTLTELTAETWNNMLEDLRERLGRHLPPTDEAGKQYTPQQIDQQKSKLMDDTLKRFGITDYSFDALIEAVELLNRTTRGSSVRVVTKGNWWGLKMPDLNALMQLRHEPFARLDSASLPEAIQLMKQNAALTPVPESFRPDRAAGILRRYKAGLAEEKLWLETAIDKYALSAEAASSLHTLSEPNSFSELFDTVHNTLSFLAHNGILLHDQIAAINLPSYGLERKTRNQTIYFDDLSAFNDLAENLEQIEAQQTPIITPELAPTTETAASAAAVRNSASWQDRISTAIRGWRRA